MSTSATTASLGYPVAITKTEQSVSFFIDRLRSVGKEIIVLSLVDYEKQQRRNLQHQQKHSMLNQKIF